tara:strand:- start:17035 stop:17841 length:807 start_codon:yes stop_codon:yes gene_type:complete
MFVVSKIFWLIGNPANVFVFLLMLGTLLSFTRFRRVGRRLIVFATAIIVFFTIFPIGGWLSEHLENRFPANPEIPPNIAGIIVLGGTINQHITATRKQPSISNGGARFTEFIYLARQFPNARLIFSGGSGSLVDQSAKEADAAKLFFDRMGMDDGRVLYERKSRNTLENAEFSRALANELFNQKWVLVTSAIHMPRAVGVFRNSGWNILPYPVGHLTDGNTSFQVGFHALTGLTSMNRSAREWLGLLVYWILGRTDTFFPAPGRLSDN